MSRRRPRPRRAAPERDEARPRSRGARPTPPSTEPRSRVEGPLAGAPQPPPKIEPTVRPWWPATRRSTCSAARRSPSAKRSCLRPRSCILVIIWSVRMVPREGGTGGRVLEGVLFILFMAVLIFGFAFILTGLAFVSRRQLEDATTTSGSGPLHDEEPDDGAGLSDRRAVPVAVLSGDPVPARARPQQDPGMASTVKIGFILPMIFAFITVLGALVYQIASMLLSGGGRDRGRKARRHGEACAGTTSGGSGGASCSTG